MTTLQTDMTKFCTWDGDTLVLNILGTPIAKHDQIRKPSTYDW